MALGCSRSGDDIYEKDESSREGNSISFIKVFLPIQPSDVLRKRLTESYLACICYSKHVSLEKVCTKPEITVASLQGGPYGYLLFYFSL